MARAYERLARSEWGAMVMLTEVLVFDLCSPRRTVITRAHATMGGMVQDVKMSLKL